MAGWGVLTILGTLAASIAALLHVGFFVLESVRFQKDGTWRRFRVADDHVDAVAPVMLNQGWYNLLLAIVTLVGMMMLLVGPGSSNPGIMHVGLGMAVAGLSVMMGAGIVLAVSSPALKKAAALQATPPAVAIICFVSAVLG